MAIKINLMPQKENVASAGKTGTPFYFLIIFVLFVICFLAYLGIYSYNTFFLKKQLDNAEKQGANVQDMIARSISPEDSLAVTAAITKGKSVQVILSDHVYMSKIYELLEKITIKGVSYNSFSEKDNNDDTISVSVGGEAESYNMLAKQLMILKKTKEIADIVFLEASVEKDGKISFSYVLFFNSNVVAIQPVIILSGFSPIQISKGSVYSDAGATAIDGIDGEISVKMSGAVNTSIAGTYTLTYTAVNSIGNSATAIRTVEVLAQ